jgi:hypothetical protein
MRRRRRGLGWSVIDTLSTLTFLFLVLSLTISDSPATPTPPGIPLGQLTVQLTWDIKVDADVDLWMTGPGETEPVGFMNTHGKNLNLAWDDLGRSGDDDSQNVEFMEAERAPAGSYIVNSMLFTDRDGKLPVHVKVVARYNGQTIRAEGDLMHHGDEITVMRFTIDAKGHIALTGNMFMPLYRGAPQ